MEKYPAVGFMQDNTPRETVDLAAMDEMFIHKGTISHIDELEEFYGTDSETLAQNAALLWVVSLSEMNRLIQQGPEDDGMVFGRVATENIIELTSKFVNVSERRAGYSLLTTMFSDYAGSSPENSIEISLGEYSKKLHRLLTDFSDLDSGKRETIQKILHDETTLFMSYGMRYLEGVLDDRRMLHEGGELDDLHMNLYRSFCAPFLFDSIDRGVSPSNESQFTRKMICEAQYLFPEISK